VYLGLCVGLQSEQTAHLGVLGVDHAGPHEVGGVWVHAVQQSGAKPHDLKHDNVTQRHLLVTQENYTIL
jgi:hypothetical protein